MVIDRAGIVRQRPLLGDVERRFPLVVVLLVVVLMMVMMLEILMMVVVVMVRCGCGVVRRRRSRRLLNVGLRVQVAYEYRSVALEVLDEALDLSFDLVVVVHQRHFRYVFRKIIDKE